MSKIFDVGGVCIAFVLGSLFMAILIYHDAITLKDHEQVINCRVVK